MALAACAGLATAQDSYRLPPMHHPVEVAFPESMHHPAELAPGESGELVCDTCHGIEDLKEIPLEEVDAESPEFLHLGPYRNLTDFCYHCHEEQGHERYNLHVMLDEQGEVDERGCIYCHLEAPDPSVEDQDDEMEFRLPKEKLCYGCHLKTPHLNTLTHQTEPDEKVLEHMRLAEKRHGVHLPLDDRGWVTCITCHTPHQQGVIDTNRPAGRQVEDQPVTDGIANSRTAWSRVFARDKAQRLDDWLQGRRAAVEPPEYLRVEKEVLIRLSARDGTLCLSCHEFED
jgi:hypothetical protein